LRRRPWYPLSLDPNVRKTEFDGNVLVGSTPEQLRQLMSTETSRWRSLIRDAGLKLEAQ
jgi:hypothetical protein